MKKIHSILLISLLASSASALAMGFSAEQGKNFTNLNMEMGKSSSGVYLESNWIKNTQDGTQLGSGGVGYNLGTGPGDAECGRESDVSWAEKR